MKTIRTLAACCAAALTGEILAAGGIIVNPANESGDFIAPKGAKGFAWSKLRWDARCGVEVILTDDLPGGIAAGASKYPGGRVLVYASRTNDAPGKVDFTISLANGGTLRGAKTFAVDAADKRVETVARYDNYGNLLASLGPGEGLLVDADPLAQMPFVDLSAETNRQFVIAEGTPKFYNGHPTMTACETPDHLIAVWTSEHAGPCGPAAESTDGGKTWTRIDERLPAGWKKAINCPSVYYLKGPDGKGRLWAWANAFGKRELASMMPSVMSEDNGKSWKLMPPLGEKFRCVMAFTSVVRLPDGTHFAAFHRSQKALKSGWQDVAPHEVAGTFSKDGGFTWSDPFVVASDPKGEEWYCEPGVFLSPDGTELCCLLREQHRGLSRMCFSKDFGKTWSKPVPTSRGLSGHRHVAHVLPDGLVAVAMRSWYQPLENPNRDPHFGCWIGPYSSVRAGTDADATMVKLLEPKPGKNWGSWDTGYPAFAINGAREIVAATYIHYRADGNRHSIAGIRFDPREILARTRFQYQKEHDFPSVSLAPARDVTVRRGLGHFFAKCVPGATVRVAYFGGSITEANGWKNFTFEWLKAQYPETKFELVDAALGGTGSDYGAYRIAKDVLPFKPDLMFVEFAVNDGASDQRRNIEGYVRNFYASCPDGDVVFAYTLGKHTSRLLQGGYLPTSAATFERVADHYGIPSVAMGLEAARMANRGELVWNRGDRPVLALAGSETEKDRPEDATGPVVFLSDGAHPYRETGHRLYADAVIRALEAIRAAKLPAVDRTSLPGKLFADCLGPVSFYTPETARASGLELVGDKWRNDTKIQTSWWRDPPSFYKFYKSCWRCGGASEIRFRFKGASAQIAAIRGPGTGRVEIVVDGDSRQDDFFDLYCGFWRLAPYMICRDLNPEQVHEVVLRNRPGLCDREKILREAGRGDMYDEHAADFKDEQELMFCGLFVEGELVR